MMLQSEVVSAIIFGKPGVQFEYGFSDASATVADLSGLVWPAGAGPVPLLSDVQGWAATVKAENGAAAIVAGFQAAADTAQAGVAQNLADSLPSPAAVQPTFDAVHAAAKVGIANFKKDIAAWPTLTDAQKLTHVLGLMQSMVGVLQYLSGDYS